MVAERGSSLEGRAGGLGALFRPLDTFVDADDPVLRYSGVVNICFLN
jgi:hypothetical protein